MAFQRTDGECWSISLLLSLVFFSSLAQLLKESGDDQASIGVPPQLEWIKPTRCQMNGDLELTFQIIIFVH